MRDRLLIEFIVFHSIDERSIQNLGIPRSESKRFTVQEINLVPRGDCKSQSLHDWPRCSPRSPSISIRVSRSFIITGLVKSIRFPYGFSSLRTVRLVRNALSTAWLRRKDQSKQDLAPFLRCKSNRRKLQAVESSDFTFKTGSIVIPTTY